MEDTDKKIIKLNISKYASLAKEAVIFSLAAFLCALSSLPYGIQPFGISIAAARRKSILQTVSLYAGAAAGILLSGNIMPLAALILTLPLKIILAFLLPKKKQALIPPLCAGISLLFLCILNMLQYGFITFDLVTGLASVTAGTYFASRINPGLDGLSGRISEAATYPMLLLCAAAVNALSEISFYGISPAVILFTLITLFIAETNDVGLSCACAVICGCAAFTENVEGLKSVIALAASALILSSSRLKNRLLRLSVFSAVFCLVSMFAGPQTSSLAVMGTVSGVTALYMLLPEKYLIKKRNLLGIRREADGLKGIKEMLCARLEEAGASMEGIASVLKKGNRVTDMDIYNKVNEAVDGICKDCQRSPLCWGGEYSSTKDAFNKASNGIKEKGLFRKDMLPDYMLSTCIKKTEVINGLTLVAASYTQDTLTDRLQQSNRSLLADQYEGISGYIKEICREISAITLPDNQKTSSVYEYLNGFGKAENTALYTDGLGALHLETRLISNKRIFEGRFTAELSEMLERNMARESFEHKGNTYEIKLIQSERYSLNVAQINRKKDGEGVCGDNFISFRSAGYKQFLALSDGMGAGVKADRLSTLTLDILQNLLENGFGEEKACALVNSSLMLSGDGQSFSTLDLASVNLFNGRADFYKLGAAPTLILRKGKVYEIFCRSLPAGIMEGTLPEHKSCRLKEGDTVIMFSDGIEVTENMLELCRENGEENPLALCEKLIGCKGLSEKAQDDMTVAVARINLKKSA